ncbi:extracellular catalytic domain type 1 short-chain-length polyhydroxyalkanoate depolymerase [Roseomonas sp. USHLN139]|uniref:extracellular catalytic domain type 1 short-chain-length polyhydroxyalkanoate depolymerase n=1 Tax=Roseomonas sp. USHLN139 TaxID=3081298 RepID=UPI003B01E84A
MNPGLAELVRLRRHWTRLMTGHPASVAPTPAPALDEDAGFLDETPGNPGQLRLKACLPEALPPRAPLVVALHGCGQDAAGFDQACGWSQLAARRGFALLLPEQRRENNGNGCFNWFEPGDTARGEGEVASIAAMVERLVRRHRLDPGRVFVTGLSAGGAMTASLLACYPERFAGGAILAGLPHAAARGVSQALEAMFHPASRPAEERAAAVRAASAHAGPWPRLSIWQGEADETVRPANAEELLKQWLPLHGLDPARPSREEAGHRAWKGAVECITLPGIGHEVPAGAPEAILDFWGIAEEKIFLVGPEGDARGEAR